MKKYIYHIVSTLLIIALAASLFKKDPPETITKTEIKYIKVIDTIETVVIKEVPKVVYIKDTTQEGSPEIKAHEYQTTLKSKNSTADIKILTTGRLLNVEGFITHSKELKTVETVKFVQRSAFFLYGETSIAPKFERFELGLDYVIRNKIVIGASGSYNTTFKNASLNFKLGFKL